MSQRRGLGSGYRAKKKFAKRAVATRRKFVPKSQQGYMRVGGNYGRFGSQYGELKFFDTATNFLLDTTGEVPATGQFCLIPQGVTESTRVGRKCIVKSIQCRWNFVFVPSTDATVATNVAVAIILDTQCNGAAAAVTDVFTGNDLSTAMINLSNSERFRVLKRWCFPMEAKAGVTGAYNNSIAFRKWYKRCNIPLEFSSTTGAITEIRSNNIFMVAVSATTNDDKISVVGNVRLRFAD